MIRNSKICYNGLSPNRYFYLKVMNNGTLCIRVILQYSIAGGSVTKDSGIMNPGQSMRLLFEADSYNVCFNIINESLPNRPLVYHDCLAIIDNTCYSVLGTPQNPRCLNLPC